MDYISVRCVACINFNSDVSGRIDIRAAGNEVEVRWEDLADFVDLIRGRQAQERQDGRCRPPGER